MNLYNIKRALLSIVYPNRCPFCDKIIGACEFFCYGCSPLDSYENSDSRRTFYCIYNDKSKPIIAKAKENADGYAISAAAEMLYSVLLKNDILNKIDVIVPIPARKSALRHRGYSFSAMLGKEIASLSGKKCSPNTLFFLRKTDEQKELTLTERAKNLKGALGVKKPLNKFNVLVVDDICSSGATLDEARRALSEYADSVGERAEIYLAAFAKTGGFD